MRDVGDPLEGASPALLRPGQGTPVRTVLGTPDASGDCLSVQDAAQRYGVSVATVRRRIEEGRIPGAFKLARPQGEVWRLPLVGCNTVFGRVVSQPPAVEQPQVAGVDLASVVDAVTRLADELVAERQGRRLELQAGEEERRRLAEDQRRAEAERESARVEAARLAAELDAERRGADDLRRHAEQDARSLDAAVDRLVALEREAAASKARAVSVEAERDRLAVEIATALSRPRRWRRRRKRSLGAAPEAMSVPGGT